MQPKEEQELLTRIRRMDKNLHEAVEIINEIKMYRKFVLWAFGAVTVATGIWELIRDFRGV